MASDVGSLLWTRMTLREKVKLHPSEIGSNVNDIILAKLRDLLEEGGCTRYGLVRPSSLTLVDVPRGVLMSASLNGDVVFEPVKIQVDVCCPAPGQILPARIVNANRFGMLAHCTTPEGRVVIEAVIMRQQPPGAADATLSAEDLDGVRIGDDVFVEVLGRTFELRDPKLAVVGRLVRPDHVHLTGSGRRVGRRASESGSVASAGREFGADDAESLDGAEDLLDDTVASNDGDGDGAVRSEDERDEEDEEEPGTGGGGDEGDEEEEEERGEDHEGTEGSDGETPSDAGED